MKTLFLNYSLLAILLLSVFSPLAQAQKPGEGPEYIFNLSEETGPIRKVNISFYNEGPQLLGSVHSTMKNKARITGVFTCKKDPKETTINCYRDDGGGEFFLITRTKEGKSEYVLKFHSFNVSDEGDETEISVSSPNEKEFEIVGIKN